MPSLKSEAQAVRRQLERILESPGFSRNERLSRFLRFVVEGHLDGKDHELKESVIAIEVFGRRPDFDSRLDPVVRTEAVRLRARLSEYYITQGKADALVIELPKGGYVPRFREVEEERQVTAPIPEKTPARFSTRLWFALGLAGLVIVSAAVGWWIQHRGAPIAIAVLPLENTSRDPANDYFADGLTDELIRNLSIIDGLSVRSRTSSFAIKGRSRNIRDAGEQLHADYILEGSVLRAGPQLRINVQLVRVRDDFQLWSGRYERELTEIFAVQDDISVGIVNNLRLKLGRGRRRYETSVEAYDLYLHARALPQRSIQDALAIVGLYQQVIAKDASFAPAYAGLAAAYAAISFQGFRDHTDELVQMRSAAEKAIQLDPLSSEAHQALGMLYARDGQWAQSEKSFRRAIELEPSNSLAHSDLTINLLLPLGRIEEGVHEMQIAEKTDPLSPWIRSSLAWALLSAGRYEEAAGHCQKAAGTRCLGRARLAQGRIDEAIQILATGDLQYLGYAYGRAGRREEAEKFAADAAPNAFTQALTFAGLGDKDRTLEALDRLASNGAVRVGRALNSPEFALLRGDPRVKILRKKVGLPE
ncbi:MAG: tetratricopeptide repeat protein [Acidobacteriia bacterium]|nr:tetratricopeptide repeat protein [Terriglobia bacterium]